MATSGIYSITNTVNGHQYIGSAVDIARRWRAHRLALRDGDHHSQYLQRAWDKYGAECFEFRIVELCSADYLIDREQVYLDQLQPEYNIAPNAGSQLGYSHTDAARAKMAAYEKTPEHRAKMSAARLGKSLPPETGAKMSASRTGVERKPFSQEHRDNLSKAGMGKHPSPESLEKKSTSLLAAWRLRKENQSGPWFSEATIEKMSKSHEGQVQSDETKAKRKLTWKNKENDPVE